MTPDSLLSDMIFVPGPVCRMKVRRKRIPIALKHVPGQICGNAHRIGSMVEDNTCIALYRIKLKRGFLASCETTTLPGLFMIKNNEFVRCPLLYAS